MLPIGNTDYDFMFSSLVNLIYVMTNSQKMIYLTDLIPRTFITLPNLLGNITYNDYGDLLSGDNSQLIETLYDGFLEKIYDYVDTMYF